jgi:hypothetical protein
MLRGVDAHDPEVPLRKRLVAPKVDEVLRLVANHFAVDPTVFARRGGGRARAAAAWLAQRHTEATLRELCGHFGLSHPGSVSNLTRRIERDFSKSGTSRDQLMELERQLTEL